MLKHIVIATLIAGPALAKDRITDVEIEDFTYTYYDKIPQTKRVCNTVKVPIYGTVNSGASGGEVLGGMILGGILGKVVTGDDKGAAAGAVMGGVVSADRNRSKKVITGYRDEVQCNQETVYITKEYIDYDYSVIRFKLNGIEYAAEFNKHEGDH